MVVLEIIATILHIATGTWEGREVLEHVKADVERGDYVSALQCWLQYSVHETSGSDPNFALAELLRQLTELLQDEARKQQEHEQNAATDPSTAEASSPGDANTVVDGSLSEDGQWRWDESTQDWVPADGSSGYQSTPDQSSSDQSPSGQYVTIDAGEDGALSEDAQWRWDATAQEWVAAN
jgi:hypothetical protein